MGPSAALSSALSVARQSTLAAVLALDALEKQFSAEALKLEEAKVAFEAERAFVLDQLVAEKARLDAAVAARLVAIDEERREVEEVARKASDGDVVKLNVGGARFETSRATLTRVPESMLGRMFGRCAALVRPAADGSVFIDRDGTRFSIILDYLRDDPGDAAACRRALGRLGEADLQAMLRELDFFGLDEAILGAKVRPLAALQLRFTEGPRLRLPNRPWCNALMLLDGDDGATSAAQQRGRRKKRVIVVIGGGAGVRERGSTELWSLDDDDEEEDEAGAAFGPDLIQGRSGSGAVALDMCRVIVVGGLDDSRRPLGTTEIVDVRTGRATPGPRLLEARALCAAIRIDGRRALVVGGEDANNDPLASTEVLDIDAMTFRPGPPMRTGRTGCALVRLDGNRILVVGGYDSRFCDTTEVLRVDLMAFGEGPALGSSRNGCAAVAVDERRVLIVGGLSEDDHAPASRETTILDVETMALRPGPQMKTGRFACAAIAFDDGAVLVVGGHDCATADQGAHLSSEILALTTEEPLDAQPALPDVFGRLVE